MLFKEILNSINVMVFMVRFLWEITELFFKVYERVVVKSVV